MIYLLSRKEKKKKEYGTFRENLRQKNLNKAYKHVKANKGAPGVDGVTVDEAYESITQNKEKW